MADKHHLFVQHDLDKVGKMQVRTTKNEVLFDLAATLTRAEIVDVLTRDCGAGKYVIYPFLLSGGQMSGTLTVEVEPTVAPEGMGDAGVAVAERALIEERRRLAADRQAVAEAEAKLEAQRQLIKDEHSTQLKDLLKQQGDMLTAAAAREKDMMADARVRADAVVQDAREQAEHLQRQAEDRGRRAADDTRLDADNYHKRTVLDADNYYQRALATLETAERKLAAAEAYEKRGILDLEQRRRQVENELEQGKQALAERRLQLERENLEFRLKVQQDANDRKLEALGSQFKAQMAVTLPEEIQVARAQVEIDRERAKTKKEYGNQGLVAEAIEFAQPLLEAFMSMRQQQAPQAQLQQQQRPQIAAELQRAPQEMEPPPYVDVSGNQPVDLRSLVGGYPVPQEQEPAQSSE